MSDDTQTITAVVAHRWEVLRQGLATILRHSWPEWHVIEVDNFGTTMSFIANENVGLIVADRDLSGLDDLEWIVRIRKAGSRLRLVILADPDWPNDVLECLFAGANGYVSGRSTTLQFVACVEAVLAGGIYAPSGLAQVAHQSIKMTATRLGDAEVCFTDRQQEVFRLLSDGLSTKSIARQLGLSVGTVKVHLASVYRRLGVHSRLEAVAKARDLLLPVTERLTEKSGVE